MKDRKLKKGLVITIVLVIGFLLGVSIGISLYVYNLSPLESDAANVVFYVEEGMSSKGIINDLYESGMIRSKQAGYVYMMLNKDKVLKSGVYEISRSMSTSEILDKFDEGVVLGHIKVTFVEGKRLSTYVAQMVKTFGYLEEDVYAKLSDETYLKELIERYWFLTDEILDPNIYYPLEGYLFPDTYEFREDATIEMVFEKMLNNFSVKLTPYSNQIADGKYSIHELLSMASMVEQEANTKDDRKMVAQVFHNRMAVGMSMGSDVTTAYAFKKATANLVTKVEFNTFNLYNTRGPEMIAKLPVGPICNSSLVSIVAVIEPTDNDYLYFIADKNGKVYYHYTSAEQANKIVELKREGLW